LSICRSLTVQSASIADPPGRFAPEPASLAADLGYNEATIATLLGHKTHSTTSRYVHSADAVLRAAADAVANASMKLMVSDQAQPSCRANSQMDQSRGTN
jgi:hypothetical protein